jgi:pyridoxamine 5'-phosphate oxidase
MVLLQRKYSEEAVQRVSKFPERIEYGQSPFDEEHLATEPVEMFRQWFEQAVAAGVAEANGVCLCTSSPEDGPDGRIVLLKGYGESGFSFFTNFESDKARQLEMEPRACMVFWWQALRRQVRVRGSVARLPDQESTEYFQIRPRGSQLGAWASAQSRPVASRADLDRRLLDVEKRFPDVVPRPPHWGGYLLVPERFEFWQGRDDRLHDRFVYVRGAGAGWVAQRLMP